MSTCANCEPSIRAGLIEPCKPSIRGAPPFLLIGGDKTGDGLCYERMVPVADRLYDEHLEQLKREGLSDG